MRNIVEEKVKSSMAATVAARGSCRRKVVGMVEVNSWMVVSEIGESRVENLGKHSIMQRTGLPARDLRVLYSTQPQPSSILGREKAIIVNLEHIKVIITSSEVLMINSSCPLFLCFLESLQARVSASENIQTPVRMSKDVDGDCEVKPLLEDRSPSMQSGDGSPNNVLEGIFEDGAPVGIVGASAKQLPFEFRALEVCIESACMCLGIETNRLEDEAYPALDKLTAQINTLNLKRVKHIKSRLVGLSRRVQKVADQLENLLDDDNDMAEMYLTRKHDAYNFVGDESDESDTVKDKSYGPKPNVKELEILLEAYFSQINGILQKLSTLNEYVDNTEDYINIMLDDKQNQLLQVSIIFNTINFTVNVGIVVTALFGMNINIDLYNGQPNQFWATTGGTILGCVLLLIFSIWWGKKYLRSQ